MSETTLDPQPITVKLLREYATELGSQGRYGWAGAFERAAIELERAQGGGEAQVFNAGEAARQVRALEEAVAAKDAEIERLKSERDACEEQFQDRVREHGDAIGEINALRAELAALRSDTVPSALADEVERVTVCRDDSATLPVDTLRRATCALRRPRYGLPAEPKAEWLAEMKRAWLASPIRADRAGWRAAYHALRQQVGTAPDDEAPNAKLRQVYADGRAMLDAGASDPAPILAELRALRDRMQHHRFAYAGGTIHNTLDFMRRKMVGLVSKRIVELEGDGLNAATSADLKRATCKHTRIGGGNDHITCRDCGQEFRCPWRTDQDHLPPPPDAATIPTPGQIAKGVAAADPEAPYGRSWDGAPNMRPGWLQEELTAVGSEAWDRQEGQAEVIRLAAMTASNIVRALKAHRLIHHQSPLAEQGERLHALVGGEKADV